MGYAWRLGSSPSGHACNWIDHVLVDQRLDYGLEHRFARRGTRLLGIVQGRDPDDQHLAAMRSGENEWLEVTAELVNEAADRRGDRLSLRGRAAGLRAGNPC